MTQSFPLKLLIISCLCFSDLRADLKACTRDIEWFEEKLKCHNMVPLYDLEKVEIITALRVDKIKPPVSINRDLDEFLNNTPGNGEDSPVLILGSGIKHDLPTPQRKDIYTIDIESSINPDLVGSINDPKAMEIIPDHSFSQVIWENIPGWALLNTESFDQVYRILKLGGTAQLHIPILSARLLPLLIQETRFRNKIDPTYGKELKIIRKDMAIVSADHFSNSGKDVFLFTK